MWILSKLLGLFTGSTGLGESLRKAYEAKLTAETDVEKISAERDLQRIEAAIEMSRIAANDRWGATSLGRYLIVLPYGVWWTAVFVDSIFNMPWDILALPPQIDGMAKILIPAILIAEVGRTIIPKRK
jgi:hypothetical protein